MRFPLVEELLPPPDPVRCCERLEGLPYRLFLDSAARERGSAATPSSPPTRWRSCAAKARGPSASISRDRRPGAVVAGDALDAVRALLAPHAAEPVPGLPPFQGGAAGYLAYDWGRVLERLPAPRHDDLALPTWCSASTTGCWPGTTTRRERG